MQNRPDISLAYYIYDVIRVAARDFRRPPPVVPHALPFRDGKPVRHERVYRPGERIPVYISRREIALLVRPRSLREAYPVVNQAHAVNVVI